MKKNLILLFTFHFLAFILKAQVISTVAGNYSFGAGYSGNGGQATSAELNYPVDVAFDKGGNLYVADRQNHVVRKIDNLGIITTIAGNGVGGFSGDGGPATAAEFGDDVGVLVDSIGNIYISDDGYNMIRKINTGGIIKPFAGNYSFGAGYSGDGGQATAAELYAPVFMAIDPAGNIFFADGANYVIRKVDTLGIISTVAGNHIAGYSGDGGQATAAEINSIEGVGVDNKGNIYISDGGNNLIRKVNSLGIISTIAGNLYPGFSGDEGPATQAELNEPAGVAIDVYGNIYIADEINNVVRMIDGAGIIHTVAGNSATGYSGDGGPATGAELYYVSALAFDTSGNMFIADEYNNVIREVKDISTYINQSSIPNSQISVYPNPNNGKFTIQSSVVNNQLTVEIYNVMGEKIYFTPIINNNSQWMIDISNQPSGIYLYRINNQLGNSILSGKLMVQ